MTSTVQTKGVIFRYISKATPVSLVSSIPDIIFFLHFCCCCCFATSALKIKTEINIQYGKKKLEEQMGENLTMEGRPQGKYNL